jgi:Mrp family chromosome partitioning ATPase
MWDHLYVLTAGPMPPDPTRLLSSKKMHYLMTQFQAVFDLVIYDTPPVLGLADGKLLATHTAGIVMVVGLGRTDRDIFLQALDGLKVSNATILGVVANGVKGYTTNSHYYYDHYYNNEESEVQKAKKLLQKRL